MKERGATKNAVLACIIAAYTTDGAPLSLAEIARRIGVTRQAVKAFVDRLVQDGALEKVGRAYIPCVR